jgi:hypothetical protein
MSERPDYVPRGDWRGLGRILQDLERRTCIRPDPNRIAPADVDQANADMAMHGCRTRYRPDGSPYLLSDGE